MKRFLGFLKNGLWSAISQHFDRKLKFGPVLSTTTLKTEETAHGLLNKENKRVTIEEVVFNYIS